MINRRNLSSEYMYVVHTDKTCLLQSMFSLGTDLGQPSRASQLSLGNAREETTPGKAP